MHCSGYADMWIFLIAAVALVVAGALYITVYTVDQKGDSATDAEKARKPQLQLTANVMILVAGLALLWKTYCEGYLTKGLKNAAAEDQAAAVAKILAGMGIANVNLRK